MLNGNQHNIQRTLGSHIDILHLFKRLAPDGRREKKNQNIEQFIQIKNTFTNKNFYGDGSGLRVRRFLYAIQQELWREFYSFFLISSW